MDDSSVAPLHLLLEADEVPVLATALNLVVADEHTMRAIELE